MTDRIDPVFHLESKECLATRMTDYMVALKFKEVVPNCRISNANIPEWGIYHPPIESLGPVAIVRRDQYIYLQEFARQMQSGQVRRIELSSCGLNMANFLAARSYHSVFVSPYHVPKGYGSEYLVCPVTIGQAENGATLDYPITPVGFYREIVAMTGLIPIFIGQTQPNAYTHRLRAEFPNAFFREPQDNSISDFETIRHSKNVVVSVSTYYWLAAWLSPGVENIYLTVNGLFNRAQKPTVNMLPFGDTRYKFFLFPINYSVALEHHEQVHRRIVPFWRLMPHSVLERQYALAPRFKCGLELMLENFAEDFYLSSNLDVAEVAKTREPGFARWHYARYGFNEGRYPIPLDPVWYASQYPLAAFEVAQGDYPDFAHHFVAVGRIRGYLPCPPVHQLTLSKLGTVNAEVTHNHQLTPTDLFPTDGKMGPDQLAEPPSELQAECVNAEKIADRIFVVEITPKSQEPANIAFERCFNHIGTNPFLGWNPNSHVIRSYQFSDAVLDGDFRGVVNSRGFVSGTGYLLSDDIQNGIRIDSTRLVESSYDGIVIVGCNVAQRNYFHWMTQSLPAIAYALQRMSQNEDLAVALPPLERWQEESLRYLGYQHVKRFTIHDPARQYSFRRIEYNEILNGGAAFCLSETARKTYVRLGSVLKMPSVSNKKIYVARVDAPTRRMRNEDLLVDHFQREGFEIVVPGMHSLLEQIRIFQNAHLVVGAHGAGMTNIVFCRPGTIVYELLPSHYTNACFCNLAHVCGLRYWADAFHSEGEGLPNLRDWEVNSQSVFERLMEIEAIRISL
jgi:hypothetical protein